MAFELQNIVNKMLNEYVAAKNQTFGGNPFGVFVRNEIPNTIYNTGLVDRNSHLITGSVGQGNWAMIPWVCIFNRAITTSATKGVYIVYLLSKDGNTLYLTFNQGCTELKNKYGKQEAIRMMRANANKILGLIDYKGFNTYDSNMSLGRDLSELGEMYEKGTILYKAYRKGNVPSEDVLLEDLSNMMDIYDEYASNINDNDIKSAFLKFLGPVDGLNGYQKSYKLVLYKVMFDLMNDAGECSSEEVAKAFRQFYVDRVNVGKIADVDVDKRIEFIKNSSVKDIYNVITANPFKVISEKGFMFKTNEPFEQEKMCFNADLIDQISDADLYEIGYIIDKKLELYFSKIDDAWYPSKEEYDPNLTKEQWKKYILEVELPDHPSPMKMLKGMMELGGEASCKQLAAVYGGHPSTYVGCTMNLGRRAKKYFDLPICMDGDQERYFPIPFYGKAVDDEDGHSYIYRIRPELLAALNEIDLSEINPYIEEGEKMTIKEKVSAIKNYIASKGFNYEGNLIENFYLSLKSKPFVILAGTSGTGKTRLVKLFAEAIGAKLKLVPVRPDWSDSSDLFGYVDLSNNFNPGAILKFIKDAQDNTDKPYFLCLDEMNLARVEYYFSDFLSIIETRKRSDDGKIVSEPLVPNEYYKNDTVARDSFGEIIIPENLYIIGTVNMDETTFPFSKKVLDRANTIEFSFVDLMAKPSVEDEAMPRQLSEDNSFLKTEYLYLNDVNDDNIVTTTCFELEQFNQILLKANLHVGYRVRDEITFYMSNNKNSQNLISETAAFDNQIMQKILPRIQGSSSAIKEVLIEMFQKCAGDYSGLTGSNTYEQMMNCIETKECKYPNTAKKIAFMVRRFEEDGFTSYWL